MASLLRLLIQALIRSSGRFVTAFASFFGMILVRGYVWLQVVKLGVFFFKLGIFIALLEAMKTGIDTLATNIEASVPPALADGIGRILPDNFYACVSAILMAKLVVFTFTVKDRVLGNM